MAGGTARYGQRDQNTGWYGVGGTDKYFKMAGGTARQRGTDNEITIGGGTVHVGGTAN